MRIRELRESDRPWAIRLVADYFGSPEMVTRGMPNDTRVLPGLVAEAEGRRAGLLLYRLSGDQCEIIALVAPPPRRGIGRALVEALCSRMDTFGCRRVWLVTTNDNEPAQRFFRSVGLQQVAVHKGAVDQARAIKPVIPTHGYGGQAIRDEIEFEVELRARQSTGPEGNASPESPWKPQE